MFSFQRWFLMARLALVVAIALSTALSFWLLPQEIRVSPALVRELLQQWSFHTLLLFLVIATGLSLYGHQRSGKKRTIAGTELVTPREFVTQIRGDGVFIPTYTTPPGFLKGLQFFRKDYRLRIRRDDEATHMLLLGDSGMGKSALIHSLLTQIRERNERVIIYDPSLEFWEHHGLPGDVVLHPLSSHCPHWLLKEELDSPLVAQAVARSLLPGRSEHQQDFWEQKSQAIMAFLIGELGGRGKSIRTLVQWLTDEEQLDRLIVGTEIAQDLNPDAVGQRAGILSSLNRIAKSLKLLPRADGRPNFSFRRWYEGNEPGWVFMGTRGFIERPALLPLISAWIDIGLCRAMKERGGNPLWFFVDELPSLGLIPSLRTGIQEGRKNNIRFVNALQGISQLEQLYGKSAATLASCHSSQIQLRARDAESATQAAANLGKPLQSIINRSYSRGSSDLTDKNITQRNEEKVDFLVPPDVIRKLKKLNGFLTYDGYLLPIRFDYPPLTRRNTFK